MGRRGTALLSTLAVIAFLACESAAATPTTVKNPAGTISVRYDDGLWSASRQGERLNFTCNADACGGTATWCNFAEILPEGGATPPTFTKDTLATLGDRLLADFAARAPGSQPEVVEPATERPFGVLYGVFASVRATVDGVLARYSYFYMDAYDAILVVGCSAPEDRYQAAQSAHDALKAGARLPRPAQPDPK